jgi:hypothetical protein
VRVLLERLDSTNNALRTNNIEGYTLAEPQVGACFLMFGEPLDPAADARMVSTSLIQSVERDGEVFTFTTLNSTYRVTILDRQQ